MSVLAVDIMDDQQKCGGTIGEVLSNRDREQRPGARLWASIENDGERLLFNLPKWSN